MFCRKCGEQIPDDSAFCYKCGTAVHTVPSDAVDPSLTDTAQLEANGSLSASPTTQHRTKWRTGIIATVAVIVIIALFALGDKSVTTQIHTPADLIEQLTSAADSQSLWPPVAGEPINEKWLDEYPVTQYTIGDQITLHICEYPDTGEIALISITGDGKLFDGDDAYTMGFYAGTLMGYYTSSTEEAEHVSAVLHMNNDNLFTPVDESYQSESATFRYDVDYGIVTFQIDLLK